MPVPLNDLSRIYALHRSDLEGEIGGVLASGRFLDGERVRRFADAFARYLGVSHCLPVANGTDALELAMRAAHAVAGPRRIEVVTVANAGGYATTACLQAGLKPVLVDIEEDSQLMSIAAAVAALGETTLAVVATHLYGGLVDVAALRRAMTDAGFGDVAIIEDCAQAHGLEAHGRKAGALGDLAAFSFYPTKNLGAFGDAGAVATSSDVLAEHVEHLHRYGWGRDGKYRVEAAGGRNSRMDELQAGILLALLPHLDRGNARRRAILDRYERAAGPGLRFVRSRTAHVAHLAVALCEDRDGLRGHLSARGIASDIHYPILDCHQPGWARFFGEETAARLPVSRRSVPHLVTLPCFPTLTEPEISQVCEALSEWSPR